MPKWAGILRAIGWRSRRSSCSTFLPFLYPRKGFSIVLEPVPELSCRPGWHPRTEIKGMGHKHLAGSLSCCSPAGGNQVEWSARVKGLFYQLPAPAVFWTSCLVSLSSCIEFNKFGRQTEGKKSRKTEKSLCVTGLNRDQEWEEEKEVEITQHSLKHRKT